MNLYVDHREKFFDIIQDEFNQLPIYDVEPANVIRKTLEIGDFIITKSNSETDEKILAIFERKTLDDYGQSIVDGRIANIDGLLKLRETTNCQVYIIVEGTQNPALNSLFGGLEYYKILANFTDLEILQNIHILRTASKLGTAKQLKIMCERYTKLYPKLESRILGSGEVCLDVEKSKPTKDQLMQNEVLYIWANLLSKSEKINTKTISTVKASVIAKRWTLKDWVNGQISEDEIAKIKVNNRRLDGWQIEYLSNPLDKNGQIKLLSIIKGITPECANAIIGQASLKDFLAESNCCNSVFDNKNKKIGKAKYNKILALCTTII